jgi:hypothetical protein
MFNVQAWRDGPSSFTRLITDISQEAVRDTPLTGIVDRPETTQNIS